MNDLSRENNFRSFIQLLNDSPEFGTEVYLLISSFHKCVDRLVPLKEGGMIGTIKIPENLALLLECPPSIDLEPELIEIEEDAETPAS